MALSSNMEMGYATAKQTQHRCRFCEKPLTQSFANLGMTPLCESFLSPDQIREAEEYFPLHAYVCDGCYLVQLDDFTGAEHIFREYAYFSSYSTSWVEHAKVYCHKIAKRLDLNSKSFVVELASNDGYLLQHFLPMKIDVLGIEPARNIAAVAIEKGVPTLSEFFGTKLALEMAAQGRKADLIIGNNVLAQVPDLNDFVAGMQRLLKDEGMITLEFPHLERLVDENQFDTIYHEHFSYFSLITIEKIAARHRLKIVDVEELKTHGGSLRVYLAHRHSCHEMTFAVSQLLSRERQRGFDRIAIYDGFQNNVQATKHNLLSFLIEAKRDGKSICGYGAPGKGNTLLNYCGIGTDFLDFTVDRNPYKHARFTPGMRIPIKPVEAIYEHKPDLILILPWNLKREIIQQMHDVGEWDAKFIVPIPTVMIVEPRSIAL